MWISIGLLDGVQSVSVVLGCVFLQMLGACRYFVNTFFTVDAQQKAHIFIFAYFFSPLSFPSSLRKVTDVRRDGLLSLASFFSNFNDVD